MSDETETPIDLSDIFAEDGDMYVNLEEFLLGLVVEKHYPEYADNQFENNQEKEN